MICEFMYQPTPSVALYHIVQLVTNELANGKQDFVLAPYDRKVIGSPAPCFSNGTFGRDNNSRATSRIVGGCKSMLA